METFIEPRELANNPQYQAQREKSLGGLDYDTIDKPIANVIKSINELPYCFTLQCCYGHFLYGDQQDPHNLEPIPVNRTVSSLEYRIAYICLCIDNSASGKRLIEAMKEITKVDPKNVQFCCAEWFWERQVNSYVLQVEPVRFKDSDRAIIGYDEALAIVQTRVLFFEKLEEMV